MKTKQEQIEEIMETLLAHQPIIDVPYEQINDIAIALVQEGYGDVKQAKISVLNELKGRAIGYTFLGEKLATETVIDGLIEEVENENNSKTNISRFG